MLDVSNNLAALSAGVVDVISASSSPLTGAGVGSETVASSFTLDSDGWAVKAVSSAPAAFSPTSSGPALNRYVYGGDSIALVVGANNNVRWRFVAPSKFLRSAVTSFAGTLRFTLAAFAGDLAGNTRYSNPSDFVTLVGGGSRSRPLLMLVVVFCLIVGCCCVRGGVCTCNAELRVVCGWCGYDHQSAQCGVHRWCGVLLLHAGGRRGGRLGAGPSQLWHHRMCSFHTTPLSFQT